MTTVFADAVYLIARLNRRDQYHVKALNVSRQLNVRLVTSEWVLLKVADAFAGSEYRLQMRDLFRRLNQPPASEVVFASSEILNRALEFYHLHRDKEWTLTDCTSFLIMQERGITEALTGDHHFEQAEFIALLK